MKEKDNKRETAVRRTVKKRNKRRKRKLMLFFSAFMIIALAVFLVLSATVLFPIKNVVVEGKSIYTEEDIISASGIEDDNIIMLSKNKVINRIAKKLPQSGKITVKKQFPDTVKITVDTAVPTYYFVADGVFYVTDSDYKVIERGIEAPAGCMLLRISDFKGPAPGNKVKISDENKSLLKELKSLCEVQKLKVTGISVSNDIDLRIIINDRILVLLGSRVDLERKLLHLSTMLPEMEESAQGTVDLSNWTSNDAEAIFRDKKIDIFGFATKNTQKMQENS
ncbi:MAG: FtsQ-type POTRA domain-containing protein [Clostridia bacterium]|nr:FtsQ-type POTRA domain-containing protein [Clostridia bacterium]